LICAKKKRPRKHGPCPARKIGGKARLGKKNHGPFGGPFKKKRGKRKMEKKGKLARKVPEQKRGAGNGSYPSFDCQRGKFPREINNPDRKKKKPGKQRKRTGIDH